MLVKDQLVREITIKKTPERIISLVPSQTELIVSLGLRERLVGITRFCIQPPELKKEKEIVGGTKKVNYNKIKSLNPDIIICNKEENSEEIVGCLVKIAPVWVSDISSIEDALTMIRSLGHILGAEKAASDLVAEIHSEKIDFENTILERPSKSVAYVIWKKPYMVAGKSTFINAMLTLNKFDNIISEKRYPEVTSNIFKQAELILLSTEPYPFTQRDAKEIEQKYGVKTILVDGAFFSWYGSRMKQAFRYFKSLC